MFIFSRGVLLFALPFWGFTVYAFFQEKHKVSSNFESFEDDNLFYRYGSKVSNFAFPLKLAGQVDDKELLLITSELTDHLVDSIRIEIDYSIRNGGHRTESITVVDKKNKTDPRTFTRLSYKGIRGGEVNHFILFEYVGSYILIHLDSFLKGIPHWYDKVYFLFSSPYRAWFWIVPWLRNDFSILAKVSLYLDNSFESYDLTSYYVASRHSIFDAIKEYLVEKGLLTPELESIINYQIIMNQNIQNSNQVSVQGSNNVLDSITQAIK